MSKTPQSSPTNVCQHGHPLPSPNSRPPFRPVLNRSLFYFSPSIFLVTPLSLPLPKSYCVSGSDGSQQPLCDSKNPGPTGVDITLPDPLSSGRSTKRFIVLNLTFFYTRTHVHTQVHTDVHTLRTLTYIVFVSENLNPS